MAHNDEHHFDHCFIQGKDETNGADKAHPQRFVPCLQFRA